MSRSGPHLRTSRRMARLLKRRDRRGVVLLNLVSMIDIFTTLVFFLLIVTTSVATLRNPRSVDLPNSISTAPPHDTPVLTVTGNTIALQGRPVMATSAAMASRSSILAPLEAALLAAPLMPVAGRAGSATRGEINVMADKEIPYSLLKKVMATCGAARFARIALSVNHVPGTTP